jgi:uncharacterized protein (TIGR02145 family)
MKTHYLYLVSATLVALTIGCNNDDKPGVASNRFTDPRDQQSYETMTDQSGYIWFKTDLNYREMASHTGTDEHGDFAMYTWSKAVNACPEGFRLPTRGDYKRLLDQFPDGDDTGADNTAEAFAGLTAENGLRLLPRGMYVMQPDQSPTPIAKGAGEYGYFWSSTKGDNDKPHALRLDAVREAAYLQTYDKRGMGSCRCVRDPQ